MADKDIKRLFSECTSSLLKIRSEGRKMWKGYGVWFLVVWILIITALGILIQLPELGYTLEPISIILLILIPLIVAVVSGGLLWLAGKYLLNLVTGFIGGTLGLSIYLIFYESILRQSIDTPIEIFIAVILGLTGFIAGSTLDFSTLIVEKLFRVIERGREDKRKRAQGYYKILDTSAIIDGRIEELAKGHFIEGTLVIPKFVLEEVHKLADSQDPVKRSRARRGLEILSKLKNTEGIDLKLTEKDYKDIDGVDKKLIKLAQEMGGTLITSDYNLIKVAELEGVKVFNINALAQALRPKYLPGEKIKITVIREGKEKDQGVGYLEDGTMVVVERGKEYIGQDLVVKVLSILQTQSGRIIFTEPAPGEEVTDISHIHTVLKQEDIQKNKQKKTKKNNQ